MSPRFDEPTVHAHPKHDIKTPHSARIWNYWLGGKDNYAIDRETGDQVEAVLPSIVIQAREDRAFLRRVVRYLAGTEGIRQFLDIGTGLPTADNTHEVAQRIAPASRVVYVDNDPMVLVHARAVLTSSPEGACAYVDADLHDPDAIINAAGKTLDFAQPIGLMLLGVVHHITDIPTGYAIVHRLKNALAPGSFVAINHATNAIHGRASDQAVEVWNRFGKPPIRLRSPEQIRHLFDGLELLEPGVVSCSRWRPGPGLWSKPTEVDEFCGVARKVTRCPA